MHEGWACEKNITYHRVYAAGSMPEKLNLTPKLPLLVFPLMARIRLKEDGWTDGMPGLVGILRVISTVVVIVYRLLGVSTRK